MSKFFILGSHGDDFLRPARNAQWWNLLNVRFAKRKHAASVGQRIQVIGTRNLCFCENWLFVRSHNYIRKRLTTNQVCELKSVRERQKMPTNNQLEKHKSYKLSFCLKRRFEKKTNMHGKRMAYRNCSPDVVTFMTSICRFANVRQFAEVRCVIHKTCREMRILDDVIFISINFTTDLFVFVIYSAINCKNKQNRLLKKRTWIINNKKKVKIKKN